MMRRFALLVLILPMLAIAVHRIQLIDQHHYAQLDGPTDPDPWLRLVLVRDWLQTGDWFSHAIPRSNVPDTPSTSPWTRPLDLAIAALVKLQPGTASLNDKLMRAAALLPPLWMLLLVLGLQRALRELGHDNTLSRLWLCGLLAIPPGLWGYFHGGNADHHAPLAALWSWAFALSLKADPRPRDRYLQGLLLALMLWISPEALILIAILYFWPWQCWCQENRGLWPLVHLTSGAAYGSLLALAIERPPAAWLTPVYDSISIVHVLLLALCAMAVRILVLLPETWLATPRRRITLSAVLGGMVVLAMALAYPKFFHGPMADVDPYIHTRFLPAINEAHPLFSQPFPFALAMLFQAILAFGAYGWMQETSAPAIGRRKGQYLLYLLLATAAMTMAQLRWHYYLFPITSTALAAILASLYHPGNTWPSRLMHGNEWRKAAISLGLPLFITALPFGLLLAANLNQQTPEKQCEAQLRSAIRSGELVSTLGEQPLTLFAPTNVGTELLFFTPYRIIASNYHREGAGLRYLWEANPLHDDHAISDYLAQRHVDVLMLCPNGSQLYQHLMSREIHGHSVFLHRRISLKDAETLGIWRITPSKQRHQ